VARENLELARGVVGNLQALFDLFDEEIVWDTRSWELEDGTPPLERGLYRGKQAVIDHIAGYVGTWSDYRFEIEAMTEVGDSVVLSAHETGRGRGSGAPMEHRYCMVWSFRDGRIVRGGTYRDKAQALEALARR
jgi:ketosteroid isomerase-like protein